MNEVLSHLNQFHFLRPELFWLLVPVLLLLLLKQFATSNTQWHQVIPAHLANVLLSGGEQKVRQNNWLVPLLWLVTVSALAGPTWQKIEKPVFQIKRASVIVMDMSMSMRSTDVKPNRLSKAKYKAIDLANAIEDGEIALVAYAGDAFTISPLTPDSKNIVNLIPSLSPEIMPEPGSYPLLGLTKASELLKQAGFVKGDIYWLTDGVDHEDIAELNQYIGNSNYTFHVMAFGTSEGAPIQMMDKSLLKDHLGNIVIPKLNAQQLAQLATVGNGVFVKSTASDLDVTTLLSAHSFKQGEESQEQQEDDKLLTGDDWQEAGPYLVIFLLPFVLYAFRRGVTLSLFVIAFMYSPTEVYAQNEATQAEQEQPVIKPTSWTDFVFDTKDQVANKDYQQGNYAQAQATFESPQWKGSSAYKAGDFEAALSYFEQDNSATGLYNQGNALAQLNKLDEAIAAYDETLKLDPDHLAAIANKALLEQLKQQQEQQNQDDSQQQQNQQQQDQQGGQQQEQENSEQQDDSQQQNQQSQNDSQQNSEQQEQNSQQGQSDSQPEPTAQESENEKNNDQQQNGEQESEQQQSEQEQEQQASAQESQEPAQEQGKQQAAQLTPEQLAEQEAQQKLEQLLRKVSDDPSVLLRNKMILESRKRQQFARPPKGAVKSW